MSLCGGGIPSDNFAALFAGEKLNNKVAIEVAPMATGAARARNLRFIGASALEEQRARNTLRKEYTDDENFRLSPSIHFQH